MWQRHWPLGDRMCKLTMVYYFDVRVCQIGTFMRRVKEGLCRQRTLFCRHSDEVAPSSLYPEAAAGYLRVITGATRWWIKFTV